MSVEMTEWTTIDKSTWPDGPWKGEPDKVQWIDPATDLDCLMHRGPMGNWCGYVGVPPSHPAHGLFYDYVDVDVHGGLTYASLCQEGDDPAEGICHVPAPGREPHVWWLGFDFGHAWDRMPAYEARSPGLAGGRYWTRDEVAAEVTALARQLAERR